MLSLAVWIGIIGGIMMLNTRTLARGNQFVFQGGHAPQRAVISIYSTAATGSSSSTSGTPTALLYNKIKMYRQKPKQEASVTAEPHESESTEQNHKSE